MMKGKTILAGCLLMLATATYAQQGKFKFKPKDDGQQREYQEFMDATKAERELTDSLSYLEAEKYFEFKGDEEKLAPYKAQNRQATAARDQVIDRFVEAHPQYAVSAAWVKYRFYQDFQHTAEYYDRMARLVQACPDTSYTNFINRNLEKAKMYALRTKYADFEGKQPDGSMSKLSALMQTGKYTLIDFWASWCGPCRSAIPKVKAMADDFADRLQVISVSVDQKEEAWRKAEKEEAMPWPQLWLSGAAYEAARQAYMIQSIPRLVLIDPQGCIILVTFDPSLVREKLAAQAQQFTVKGEVPGILPGCEVKLKTVNGHNTNDLVVGKTAAGGFTLSGEVKEPLLVQLEINDKASYNEGEYPKDRGIRFMLEPGTTTIRAKHFEQMPLNWEMGGTPLTNEKNVTVEGSTIQQHYQEWRNYIYDAEMAAWQESNKLWKYRFANDSKPEKEILEKLEAAERAANETVNAMNQQFIEAHPDYAISLILQQRRMENLFTLTNEELNHATTLLSNNENPTGYQQLKQQIDALRPYCKGTRYTDLTVELPDGTERKLSDYIVTGKWNFLDFWASWCGPCRAAIPSVKEMYHKMGEKVNILSLSVDRSKDAWQKAMDEEQMPWQQVLVPATATKAMTAAYQVKAIPYLLIIDPQGNIQLSTHDAGEAHAFLERL